ncbi:hypothetical protein M23134_00852 [Microscilla marina ATCC 23134]|uniref:Uncharacterized protein n=1 Tax=Microscilla marina ATCC 23134 TaxID=313606 RepID=A1ZUL2_MICM2|nr:hypothetical protein M23134_00852 [Microscilla marina ATCC 23134]
MGHRMFLFVRSDSLAHFEAMSKPQKLINPWLFQITGVFS